MTPEEIAEIAFWLIAPTGMPKERYQGRIDEIAAHIRAYGDERAAEMRAWLQAEFDRRADEAHKYYRDHSAPGNEYLYDVAETWGKAADFIRALGGGKEGETGDERR